MMLAEQGGSCIHLCVCDIPADKRMLERCGCPVKRKGNGKRETDGDEVTLEVILSSTLLEQRVGLFLYENISSDCISE